MSNDRVKNTNAETEKLGDMAHSLGAARVASFFALVTVILVCCTGTLVLEWKPIFGFGLMLAALVGTTYCFWDSWKRVGRLAQEIFNVRLERELEKETSQQ
jgi:hypothetical protein